jgi:hypothetical protein
MAYISFQPSDFFNSKLWTGTGATHAITGVGFQPDFTWIKNTDGTKDHTLTDAVRGVDSQINTNNTSAASTNADQLTAFDSDGFTLGSDGSEGTVNNSGDDFVGWNWKAGTTAVPSGGSITPSAVSFNTTNGFGIYAFTGTGSAATIAHGLGVKPDMIIFKRLNATGEWSVYHRSLGYNNVVSLNTTAASWSSTAYFNAEPTASLFSVGTEANTNGSGDSLLAYAFTSIKGFSSFGSYTGNADNDGPFCYTGFKPAYVMIKNTSATQSWQIYTWDMQPFNETCTTDAGRLKADAAEAASTKNAMDILSNGFKMRTSGSDINGSGNTVIYMAFAECPLVASNEIPGVAR